MKNILVTGASGQIGSELTPKLREKYGEKNVIASDIREPSKGLKVNGPFEILDVTKKEDIEKNVKKYNIDSIFHLAAILSAAGEQKPSLAWRVNVYGFYNILEISRMLELNRIFNPSSIAAFGLETPKEMTPQETIMRPTTMYGITKLTGELLGNYYFNKYGIDVRGIRFPGIISYVAPPGGGTTDYAVAIFYDAIKKGHYNCFVSEDTVLPMMYMPDCIKATIQLMETDLKKIKHHADFNVTGMSFSAGELAMEIKKHIPNFTIEYNPDYRQKIADSWPKRIDDSAARKEWGWKPDFNLSTMTKDMLKNLRLRLKSN